MILALKKYFGSVFGGGAGFFAKISRNQGGNSEAASIARSLFKKVLSSAPDFTPHHGTLPQGARRANSRPLSQGASK